MKGKSVIVTGAFGVLGTAVAAALACSGAEVSAIDRATEPSAGFDEALGDGVFVVGGCDLTDVAAAARGVRSAVERFGRLDALINIAGGFAWETVAGGDPATWDRLWAMNVKTCVNTCRAAIPHLERSGGRIVNIGAGAAVKAAAGMGAYAASKGGVHRLTEALAEELKGKVAVNAVLPSIIDTPMNRADMPGADPSKWVSPGDLSEVILFLASDTARAVTGALVAVNGGV
jgi:NAD(P)-dependent dehydrogenase (short-subunit alcohol dehydrogenase family)